VTGPGPQPPPQPRPVDRGQPFTVELPAVATAGYRWEAGALPDGVRLTGTEYRVKPGPGVGGTGTQVLSFTATEPGPHRIDLVYKRPWESDPADRRSVHIQVR
jgi:inhibitor of cysteine peptidase